MTAEERAKAAAEIQRADAEDAVVRQALPEALYGPARRAFAAYDDICIGRYRVRGAVDWDLKLLKQLGSPFFRLFVENERDNIPLPTGEHAWQLCWLMTKPAKTAAKLLAELGLIGIKQQAEDEFGFVPMADVEAVTTAACEQLRISMMPMPKSAYDPFPQDPQEAATGGRGENPTSASGGLAG